MADIVDELSKFGKKLKEVAENYFWADFSVENIPEQVKYRLQQLPEIAQIDFFDRFTEQATKLRKRRNITGVVGGFFLINGGFPITLGCLAYLWHIKETKVPELAESQLRDTIRRYQLTEGYQSPNAPRYKINPTQNPFRQNQDFEKGFDPLNITLENLKTGFLLDYDLRTWQVKSLHQYEWAGGSSERLFKIESVGDSAQLFLRKEGYQLTIQVCRMINIHTIDSNLATEILHNHQPYNIITYEGTTFYKENAKDGILYETQKQNKQRVLLWEYYDGQRKQILRIEQFGKNDFRAMLGKLASEFEFSDILPSS